MLLDGAHLALREAFVCVRGGELDAERVLGPKLSCAADQCGFLVPREHFGSGAVTFPDIDAVANGASEFHDAFVAKAGHAAKFDETARDQGKEYTHDSEEVTREMFAGRRGERGIVANLAMAGAFAAGAGGASPMDHQGVANVGLGVRDV